MHRECNDEVHQMTMDHLERFTGETVEPEKEAYARHRYSCPSHTPVFSACGARQQRVDGMTRAEGELFNPMNAWTPEQRLADMDSLGIDVQVVSTNVAFYKYDQDVATTTAIAQACNNEVHQMTIDYPERFAGLATLPMQDIPAAIAELERAVVRLGLKGAMINDQVNGRTFDEPEFSPFWKAAEQMGALILIHQARPTLVVQRTPRYHLPNTIGNLVDRAVTFASFVFGGVMDACPDLKICLAHGGGYTCFGIGRMDRGWQVRSEARGNIQAPQCLSKQVLLRLPDPQRGCPAPDT